MDYPKFIVSNQKDESISTQRVNISLKELLKKSQQPGLFIYHQNGHLSECLTKVDTVQDWATGSLIIVLILMVTLVRVAVQLFYAISRTAFSIVPYLQSKMSQCMRFPTMWYVRPAKLRPACA